MYTEEYNGYCSGGNQDDLKALVRSGVDYATQLGMYVIIDWHILQDQDPNVHKDQALTFFKEMSETYADYTNVLYEICNEPNGYATWDSIKSYAEEVIPIIRANDPDAIVIVGTPTWSQDIDQALANPLKEGNVLYALHFYAGTHKDVLWNRLDSCVQNGLPVFISEFGMCDSSGSGANDFESTQNWFNVIEKYNISFCCWNLANKDETSSVIKSSCSKVSGWTEDDLSESGKWIRDYFRSK
jgi:endoglucanase